MAPTCTDATAPFANQAVEQHIVGRSDIKQFAGAGIEPLLCLRRHYGGQPGEVTSDEAHGVHCVPGSDGQCIGAELDVSLPASGRDNTPSRSRLTWTLSTSPTKPASTCSFICITAGLTRACRPTAVTERNRDFTPTPTVPRLPTSSARAAIHNTRVAASSAALVGA